MGVLEHDGCKVCGGSGGGCDNFAGIADGFFNAVMQDAQELEGARGRR